MIFAVLFFGLIAVGTSAYAQRPLDASDMAVIYVLAGLTGLAMLCAVAAEAMATRQRMQQALLDSGGPFEADQLGELATTERLEDEMGGHQPITPLPTTYRPRLGDPTSTLKRTWAGPPGAERPQIREDRVSFDAVAEARDAGHLGGA